MDAVEFADEKSGEIQIFTPEELVRILSTAREELIPWLAIAAFAGLRSSEIQRLDWSEISLTGDAEPHILVKSSKAKTGSRRLVPVSDNLARWLARCAKSEGRVSAFDNMSKQIDWLVADMNRDHEKRGLKKFAWKRNAMRHSFISYRLAIIKVTGQVALEAGNSPQMVFKHYRQLVTEKAAQQWFGIAPQSAENVIHVTQQQPTAGLAAVVNNFSSRAANS
jgi:integrase